MERTENGWKFHLEGSLIGLGPAQFVEVAVSLHQVKSFGLLCDVEEKVSQ